MGQTKRPLGRLFFLAYFWNSPLHRAGPGVGPGFFTLKRDRAKGGYLGSNSEILFINNAFDCLVIKTFCCCLNPGIFGIVRKHNIQVRLSLALIWVDPGAGPCNEESQLY